MLKVMGEGLGSIDIFLKSIYCIKAIHKISNLKVCKQAGIEVKVFLFQDFKKFFLS